MNSEEMLEVLVDRVNVANGFEGAYDEELFGYFGARINDEVLILTYHDDETGKKSISKWKLVDLDDE